MPEVVVAIGWALAGAGATSAAAISFGMFLIGAAQVIGYGLLLAAAYGSSQRAKRKAKAQYNASQVDRLVNVGTTTMPRELVLGRVRKGGSVVFRGSTGADKERFIMVIALAGHECDGIEQVYLNDTKVNVDSNGFVTDQPYLTSSTVRRSFSIPAGTASAVIPESFVSGSVRVTDSPPTDYSYWGMLGDAIPFTLSGSTVTLAYTSAYPVTVSYDTVSGENSKARIRWYLGAPGQTADSYLQSLFPGVWTADHKLTGVTYAICEFLYDETAFASGLPTVTFVMRGAKCYDPRTGLTAFTRNPALHARHVVTHPKFGQRTTLTAAEEARFVAAANACDLSNTWIAVPSVTSSWGSFSAVILAALAAVNAIGTQKLYSSDTVIPFGSTAADALDDLTQAMAGMWAYAQGQVYIRAGIYYPPVAAYTQDDLATTLIGSEGGSTQQPVTISTHLARVDKINTIKATIWDAAQDYKSVPIEAVKVDAFITRDKGVLTTEVTYPAVTSSLQAAHISRVALRDARDALTANVTLKVSAYAIELFDVIELTIPRYGWVAKPFLVLGRSWTPQGLVSLDVRETSSQIYDTDAEYAVAGFAPNTNLPSPWVVQAPSGVAISSGTADLTYGGDGTVLSNIRVRWSAFTDASMLYGGQVEVRYGRLSQAGNVLSEVPTDFLWQTQVASAQAQEALVPNVLDGASYVLQVRSRTTLAVSAWSGTYYHTVIGKEAKPSNVSAVTVSASDNNLQINITAVPDLDVVGYEIRTANSNWGDALALFSGSATTVKIAPYTLGTNTWYVKAFDSTGNYSDVAYAFTYSMAALPNVSGITSFFTDTSLTAATVTLSWIDAVPVMGLSGYEISYDSVLVVAKTNTITLPANWVGNRTFTIKTVDTKGFKSSGTSFAVEKLAPAPATDFRAQVIDNTVLLYWKMPAKTSLPIAHALLKKGATWATATSIGSKDGEFTTLTELAGGAYTYWLAVVDTDGVESTPTNLTTVVSQPPDFIFNGEFDSTFGGTKSNAFTDPVSGHLLLPVNTAESFAQHFTNNSWTTPANQIAAGYPYYPQPGLTSGYYEEVFDFGTILASSNITVNVTGSTLAGTASQFVTISLSDDNVDYVDYAGLSAVFGSNFRYVKVRLAITQVTSGAVFEVERLNVRLDAKLKSDAGSTAVTTSTAGTLFNFNTEFVEVTAINATPNTVSNLNAVCDFYDFIADGTYSVTSNIATITVTGHKAVAGGKVRLAASSGGFPLGVYTVATVPDANTFTVAVATANTSGDILMYHNFGKLYLFDAAGAQIAGTVSWSIRGF